MLTKCCKEMIGAQKIWDQTETTNSSESNIKVNSNLLLKETVIYIL